ncbi:MAG: hypothetical protein ACI4WX_16695 [Aristaeellaceae bacterium]
MKKKRIILGLFAAGLLLLLAGLILPNLWNHDGSTYDRRAEKDFFSLEMKPLNSTLSEPYALHAGDTIQVEIDLRAGELSIFIGQEGKAPVYEGRNPDLTSFRVTIPEDGTYSLSVSGKQAKGSISFRISSDN